MITFPTLMLHRSEANRSARDRRALFYLFQPAGRAHLDEGLRPRHWEDRPMPTHPVAELLFAHDGGRREPGPPDPDLQRRARALGRVFWWSKPVGIAGMLLAGAAFVVSPTSGPGIAAMVVGVAVVVATMVAVRTVGPRYGAATTEAGLPVPGDRAEALAEVARTFEAVQRGIEQAGEDGLFPPGTKRIHALTRRWDRTTDRLRAQWLTGDEAAWRASAAWLVGCGETAERHRLDVEDHVRRTQG